jgi:RHS repeat-associated protein
MVIDPVTERLTSRTVGGVTTSYSYDRAGNLVTRASGGVTWAYGYDALDRLVSVRRNSVLIARYAYDVLGRRIVKRVYSSASGGTVGYTRFVYKGSHVSFETDSAGTIGLRYTWGAGTDDLVAITTAAGAHYYVTTDKLGSVRSIAKRDGTWQLSQRFDPYGRLIVRDTAMTYTLGVKLRYGWTGREWDAETGFSYHRARYFDPESRRWTQEDPIGYAGGMNVYAYVGGSPMEATDPSGLESSLDPTFTPFCTWGGSCVDALGNVTRQGQQYAIDGVLIGYGGIGAWAGGVVVFGCPAAPSRSAMS